jgi:hypothetical protein
VNQLNISQDDILDVKELTAKLETAITDILKDNEYSLALSALMSALLNSMMRQCGSFGEIKTHFGMLIHIIHSTLEDMENKVKEGE